MTDQQQDRPTSPIDSVRAALEKLKPQMALALPKHLTPERLVRVAMTAIQRTPKLLECDRTSLFASVITCAQLGLEPDGVLGQAYLVPFKGKVQLIVGYKGYIALAFNSGQVQTIQTHEVCAGDEFSYRYGLHETLDHVIKDEDRSWDNITHFYAYAVYKDGGHVFEVMSRKQVEAIRNGSPGYQSSNDSPWDPKKPTSIQMGRKTLIRRIANYLPLQVQKAAAIEAAYEMGRHGAIDPYGDVVIEGESTNITVPEGEPAAEQQKAATTSKLDGLAGKGGKKGKAAKPAEPVTIPSKLESDGGKPTAGEIMATIVKAKSAEEVMVAVDFARGLDATDQEILNGAATSKLRMLGAGAPEKKTDPKMNQKPPADDNLFPET
jgi:recombination protein RecT